MVTEHNDYAKGLKYWQTARRLYFGGETLKQNAETYLSRRQKEPIEVYRERLAASYYENYIGSIIDWYLAALFRREPVVLSEGGDRSTQAFLARFIENCDRKGTNVSEFFRSVLRDAMLFGTVHIIIDFPKTSGSVATRADEAAYGVDMAYLVRCAPEQVTDWAYDESGNLSRISVRTAKDHSKSEAGEEGELAYILYEYDKLRVRVTEIVESDGGQISRTVIQESPHCLSHAGLLPVLRFELPHGLWLMERAGSVQLEHYNKANALAWALSMGLYATPVVYSDREWNQITGDSYFIQLGPEDKFGWTEPEGKVYQIAADNLERLKAEIFRVCHLSYQAGWGGTGVKQSGLSKQRDFQVTQEVLRAYGDWVKGTLQLVLQLIMLARRDGAVIDVSGMDQFDIGEFSTEISDAERLLAMNIGSRTLEKQVYKKLALQFLSDMRQEVKDKIVNEIEAA